MLKFWMKTEEGKRYRFILPDGPIVMRFLLKKIMEDQGNFDQAKYRAFMKAYRKVKKLHPHLVLVDIDSKDGSKILIKL